MKVSFTCLHEHGDARVLPTRSVRVELEHGRCPICQGQALDGVALGGLEWGTCPCCRAEWRVEDDRFVVRAGDLVEEWI